MELPRTWKRLFSRISVIGQQFDHPLHLQAVNRRLFNQLLTNKLLCETSATNSTSLCDAALTLSNEEENAIRYACGYVCMKVLKTLRSMQTLCSETRWVHNLFTKQLYPHVEAPYNVYTFVPQRE